MRYMKLIMSVVLAFFSTAVMSYISMATPVGPWIAPILVLCALLCFGILYAGKDLRHILAYVTIAGSIGGILATAFGFSFPTLYFLNPQLFEGLMERPYYFATFVSLFAVIAGWYGMWIANLTEKHFLEQESLPFPVAQMIYKMIGAYNELNKACELGIGFGFTLLFCMMQDGIRCFSGIIPKALAVCRSFSFFCVRFPTVSLELWPMLWAIGFVTGHMVVPPLVTGMLSKMLILQPLQDQFFIEISQAEFLLAFCSGMILSGVLQAFAPHQIIASFRSLYHNFAQRRIGVSAFNVDRNLLFEGVLVLCAASAFLFYIHCGILLQIYMLVFTFICTYQIITIAGEIGLAQLGRFATFVLVPGLFLFNLDAVQITVISTFVEAVSGVAVDVLCGRKVVQLVNGSQRVGRRYQYLGMILSCAVLGIVFWLLINKFKLGSPELFAQRSQARQLLVGVQQFDYWVLLIGVVYGAVLKQFKINPMLVLGGILMPVNISLGLILGGLGAALARKKEDWYPFWSGVFAANSIWMLLRALM